MNGLEALKRLDSRSFAQTVVICSQGIIRNVCGICKRDEENNCDGDCVQGVFDYCESEVIV